MILFEIVNIRTRFVVAYLLCSPISCSPLSNRELAERPCLITCHVKQNVLKLNGCPETTCIYNFYYLLLWNFSKFTVLNSDLKAGNRELVEGGAALLAGGRVQI